MTLDDALAARVTALLGQHERVILGVAGAPGSGKSTLAEEVIGHFADGGVEAVCLPMDGFHLADVELDRLGRRSRKGAIDTFDGPGYVSLLERIAASRDGTVYAPAFDRTIEQPIAGSIAVPAEARLVVTEGNYLLDEAPPWNHVRALLTESWFIDIDDDLRRERLVRRHVEFGKSPEAAREWVVAVDEPNAQRIAGTRSRADVIVSGSRSTPPAR